MVKTISPLFSQDAFKLITVFSLSPGSRFKRKELKELTLLNNVPLDKALLRLVNSGLLVKNKLYSLNIENEHSETLVRLCSREHTRLKRIPFKVYFMIIDLVFQASLFKGLELYLFGSYSKLVFSEKSDVDVAILTTQAENVKIVFSKLALKLSRSYGPELQLHFFGKKSFYRNKKDPLVSEIIKNGIKLI